MVYTLEDVKNFINKFVELEYQVGLARFDKSVTDEKWDEMIKKLRNYYTINFGYYQLVAASHRSESLLNDEELENKKRNLKKRRLFLIRKYEKSVFGKGIYDTDPSVLWSCFLGANVDMGTEVYAHNTSVGRVNGELKIISERKLNPEKGIDEVDWVYTKKSNVYDEGIIIKKDGKLVETLRIVEPEHPTWLADYNS